MRARYAGGGRRVQAPVRPTIGSAPAYDYDGPPLASSHFSICHPPDRHPQCMTHQMHAKLLYYGGSNTMHAKTLYMLHPF